MAPALEDTEQLVARTLRLKMDSTNSAQSPRQGDQMQVDNSMAQTLIPPGHHLAAPASGSSAGMPTPASGQSQIIHIPMCLRLKTLEERERAMRAPLPYPDYVCKPLVSKTHFVKHGPILRVLTDGFKSVPNEVTTIRLDFLYEDSIPQFLYANMAILRKWGIDQVVTYHKVNGSNVLDHPKLDLHHFMVKFTISSLNPLVRDILGTHETGVWICHYPDFIQRLRGRSYEDNSSEDLIFINMHVVLIPIHARAHTPEGGWSPFPVTVEVSKADGPAEKKSRQGPPQGRYKSNRSYPGPPESNQLVEDVDDLKRKVDDMQRQQAVPSYPPLPPSRVTPGGATPCQDISETDPILVVPTPPAANPTWVAPSNEPPRFL